MNLFFDSLAYGKTPDLEGMMKYEGLRLSSFVKRPHKYTTSASRLANAGFFYVGQEDIVECFKCHLQVANWAILGEPVDPLAVHMQRSPDCPYIINNEKENVPYSVERLSPLKMTKHFGDNPPTKGIDAPMQAMTINTPPLRSFQQQLQQPAKPLGLFDRQISTDSAPEPEVKTDAPAYVGSAGLPSSVSGRQIAQHEMSISTAPVTNNIQTPMFGSFGFPRPFEAPPLFDRGARIAPNYRDEQQRADTFRYWPNTSAVRPAELARAGFYYLGTEDRVQCAFCKGVLRNWDPVDHAYDEHKKHFPQCPVIRDASTSGNIPITDHLTGVSLRKELKNKQEVLAPSAGVYCVHLLPYVYVCCC